jgi:hypothetical protein
MVCLFLVGVRVAGADEMEADEQVQMIRINLALVARQ